MDYENAVFADELIACEVFERLESARKAPSANEVRKFSAKLFVNVVAETLNGRVFDSPVRALDPTRQYGRCGCRRVAALLREAG